MINTFTYDNVSSSSFGVYISGYDTYNAPKKVYKFIDIPNRNGSLITKERRLQNIELTYHCVIKDNLNSNLRQFRSFLLSRDGYCRLTDTYHSNEFRKAVFEGPIDVELEPLYQAAEFDITFNCQPQRWLTSGETVYTKTTADTWALSNGTYMTAYPFIRVYGYGSIKITNTNFGGLGYKTIDISDYSSENVSYIDIDCEMFDAYNGTTNLNKYISNGKYIYLPEGTNTIKASGSITSYEFTPRWWRV